MKKLSVLLLALLLALPLTACGSKGSSRDFYSMRRADSGTTVAVMWLGMTRAEQETATNWLGNNQEVRVHYDGDTLVSMTAIVSYFMPVGLTWDMTKDDIKAYYAKDPSVTVDDASTPNLLTDTKTIGGTLYTVRIVFYNDGTIKEMNQTTDPTQDALKFPNPS